MSTTTCLLADDHPALVAAVSGFLGENGFDVVGPAADGHRAVTLAANTKPELALLDWRMPHLGGADLIRELLAASPETCVAIYTADGDAALAHEAFGAGASALVLKEAPLADLVRALESVLGGGSYLDPAVSREQSNTTSLTKRELDVLGLLAQGFQHEEIGRRLGISSETVRTHLRKACDRLGSSTRTQAVATALRLGLIT